MLTLLVIRLLIFLFVLVLVGNLTIRVQAYSSWRAYIFFSIAGLAFLITAGLQLYGYFVPPGFSALVGLAEAVMAAGLTGVLWDKLHGDQQRQKDAQKLLDQWRLASNLAHRRARELEILSEVTRELTASLNLRDVLQAVANRALRIGEADVVTVFLRNLERGELTDYHVTVSGSENMRALAPARPDNVTQTVAKSGQPAFIGDVRKHPLYAGEMNPDLRAVASLPLRLEDEVVGVMDVGYARRHEFDDGEMRLLSALADAAALAVNNASLHERISKLAVTDELTGLANRRRFLDMVRAEIQRARRYQRPLTLMMVDLDRLKQINDENGHAAGDAMLRGVAQSLRASVRDTDLPARLGGDEFAVLLPETPRESALMIAERIRKTVENFSADLNGVIIRSTVSIGLVSREPGDLQDLPSLIHLADDALYRSKTRGRNAVTALEPTPAETDAPPPSAH